MSTILKALEQAEKESRQHNAPPSFDGSPSGMGISRKAVLYIPGRVIHISLFLLIGGICVVYFLSPSQKKAELPAPAPVRQKEVTSPVVPPGPTIAKPVPPTPVPHRRHSPEPIEKPTPKPLQTVIKTAPTRPATPQIPKAQPVPKPAFAPVTAKSSIAPKIPPLKDHALKIQAISWDQDTSNRIIVINNSILSEGDAIQEFQVIRIEKDAVILNDNGENYRLKFRYR